VLPCLLEASALVAGFDLGVATRCILESETQTAAVRAFLAELSS
jgi:hypothetical protein